MILIRNAKIIDGTGAPERHGDVLISGKSISAIGNFPHKKTRTVIEALGHRLVPGFINARAEGAYATDILTNPGQATTRKEGCTTLIHGADGTSLAPVQGGSLELFRKWAGADAINVNWHTMGEFQKTLAKLPLGVNFGTFAGYNTVRRSIMHDDGGDPTEKESAVMTHIMKTALEEGALGIAVNLDTAHGRRISHEEVRTAAKLCAHAKKILALALRAPTEHCMEAAGEALALYRTTGVRIIITDFLPHELNKAAEKNFRLAYEMLKEAGDGLFMEIQYDAARLVPLYELLPRFAQEGTLESMRMLVHDKGQQKKLLAGLPRLEGAHIMRVPREYQSLTGISLESFAYNRDLTLKEAIIELMRITKLRATIRIPYTATPLHEGLIKNDRVLPCGAPQSVLRAADSARLPLETAIMKMTALPASILGIAKRGIIKENYAADLVLMNDRNEVVRTLINGAVHEGGTYIRI